MRKTTFSTLKIGDYLVCKYDNGLYKIKSFRGYFYELTPVSNAKFNFSMFSIRQCHMFNKAKPKDKVKFL